MRMGAVFARGSCRALSWVVLFGWMLALGGGTVEAQSLKVYVAEGDGTLTVFWAGGPGDTVGYRIKGVVPDDLKEDRGSNEAAGAGMVKRTITGLTNGAVYVVRVTSGATFGTITGSPGRATEDPNFGARYTPGDKQLMVSWPSKAGAMGYLVQYRGKTEVDLMDHAIVPAGMTETTIISPWKKSANSGRSGRSEWL